MWHRRKFDESNMYKLNRLTENLFHKGIYYTVFSWKKNKEHFSLVSWYETSNI